MYTRMYVTHTCTCVRVPGMIYIYICIYIFVCVYTYICAHTHRHTQTQTQTQTLAFENHTHDYCIRRVHLHGCALAVQKEFSRVQHAYTHMCNPTLTHDKTIDKITQFLPPLPHTQLTHNAISAYKHYKRLQTLKTPTNTIKTCKNYKRLQTL